MISTEKQLEHTANADQLKARENLKWLFERSTLTVDDLLFNLGLFARSGLLVKFILMADLYRRVMHVPGIMCEFGTWFGQNLVLLENLRAIFEPFNKQRKLVGFDSFSGYSEGKYAKTGIYDTGEDYAHTLKYLLNTHAQCNVYGHQPCPHKLVVGDVCETAPKYFHEHQHETVALAILDMGPEEPTLAALKAIRDRLLPGSIVLLDEFTLADTPGEAKAWFRVIRSMPLKFKMERLALYPSKVIMEVLP